MLGFIKNNTKTYISIQHMLRFKYNNMTFKYVANIIYEFIIN